MRKRYNDDYERIRNIQFDDERRCKPHVDALMRIWSSSQPSYMIAEDGELVMVDDGIPSELRESHDFHMAAIKKIRDTSFAAAHAVVD